MDTNTPLHNATPPQESPFLPPPMPQHDRHEGKDYADAVLSAEEKKRLQDNANRDMRAMKGFIRVFTCPKCNKRLQPKIVGGEVQYGTCPYCQLGVYPDSRSMYTGVNKTHLTNRYVRPDEAAFKQGATDPGGLSINKKVLAERPKQFVKGSDE